MKNLSRNAIDGPRIKGRERQLSIAADKGAFRFFGNVMPGLVRGEFKGTGAERGKGVRYEGL